MQEVESTLTEGTVLQNRYTVERLLGKGGFGAVYLVRDMRVRSNLFALKEVIDPSKRDRKRFIFEGELLKQLDHPALTRVYRVFENEPEKRVYLLMDYIEGPNLEHLRQQQPGKRFPLPEVLHIMAPIMDAVGYLHSQQPPIIHRDIKPSNIIVPEKGDEPVLVDFGIAKAYDPESTTTAIRRASPGYGAPEQYSKGTNTRTDIYGLAATVYALLSGEVPVDAFTRMTALGSNSKDPLVPIDALVPGIPKHVAEAIQQALAINSQDRFATVEQFWQALNARPVRQSPTTVVAKREPESSPEALMLGAAAAGAAPVLENKTTQPRQHLAAFAAPGVPGASPARSSWRGMGRLFPFLLVLLALLVGLGMGIGFWAYLSGSHNAPGTPSLARRATSPAAAHVSPTATHATRPTATPAHKHATPTPGTAPVVVPTAQPTQQPKPTPVPTRKPTTPPVVYPNVAGAYSGNIHNTTANISGTMALSVRQSGGAINGHFTVSSPLQGSNNFTGSITTGRYIQFTVQSYNGAAPLLFWGNVASNNSMNGQYCSLDSAGQCSASAGAGGTWNVVSTNGGS